ncbi:Kinesin-like protein [Seminavis robusta]|uniref:Kinesin-like protein n=1 Tax=Seminavis robusta TaxID=568900 RepID=A0A9N8DJ82_9STRA|nr:Kinesin-like protein [Seminavis robusta]|eukprot:Sro117_g057270.1 Kinesin-like protein (1759) ;mRNA; r:13759-19035
MSESRSYMYAYGGPLARVHVGRSKRRQEESNTDAGSILMDYSNDNMENSYLMDVVGEDSGDTILGGLSTSLLSSESHLDLHVLGSKLSSQEKIIQTPAKQTQTQTPTSIITSNLLSPFSPLLQPHTRSQTQSQSNNNNGRDFVSWQPPDSFREGDLSLQPCRKVSVVVHVSYQSNKCSPDPTCTTKSPQLCLFPLVHNDDNHVLSHDNNSSNNNNNNTLSPTSATLNAAVGARDLIVVNPSAFGKFIPSEITMETARLVAQVANIESEDWARTYKFQHVIWPDQQVRSFHHMAQAMANDILLFSKNNNNNNNNNSKTQQQQKQPQPKSATKSNEHNNPMTPSTSRIVIATGSSSDKTSVIFGRAKTLKTNGNTTKQSAAAATQSNTNTKTKSSSMNSKRERLEEYGVLGVTFDYLLQNMPQYAVCALSVYEIVQEDQIHDLLLVSPKTTATTATANKNNVTTRQRTPNSVQIRQPRDGKGAVVEGLTEFPVDSLESLRDCLEPILVAAAKKGQVNNNNNRKRTPTCYQGGHIVASLKLWQSAVQHDLNRQTKCAILTFVDLASANTTTALSSMPQVPIELSKSDDRMSPGRNSSTAADMRRGTATTRQSAFLRTSVSSLGGVLKGAVMKEAGTDTVIPYRNSTLTKVLQRSLDHPDCRVVVLASLSPLSDAYDGTLSTLRYVERLLVRTGLPKSPFEKRPIKLPGSMQPSPQTDTSLSTSSPTMPTTPPQPQALMEQFAGKESILESVVSDPRQRLARFYRSQQLAKDSPTGSAAESSEGVWWNGPHLGQSPKTGYMEVDPGTIHKEEASEKAKSNGASAEPATQKEIEQDNMDPLEEERRKQSTSLAEYIMPPVSPVVNDDDRDQRSESSFESIQKQELPKMEVARSFESDPSYLHYRPPAPSNGDIVVQLAKEKLRHIPQDPPQQESPARQDNQHLDNDNSPGSPLDGDSYGAFNGQRTPSRLLESTRESSPIHDSSPGTTSHQDSSLPPEPVGMYQDPTSGRTSTGFFREMATLESSVDAMKSANHGIWQASASSIRQLKDIQLAQQSTLNDLIAQRDHAMDMARKSQEEYSKLSLQIGDLLKEKDSEIIALKDVVDKAQADRSDVEKIAEEAIAAQDTLERAVSELEKKLIANRSTSQGAQEELQRVAQAKEQVAEELFNVRNELFACKSTLNDRDITAKELEFKLKSLEEELQQLAQQQADSENSTKLLQDELLGVNETHQNEKNEWKKVVSGLKKENKALCSKLNSRESEVSNQLGKADEELKRCQGELAEARRDLEMHLQQDQIVSKSMQSERATFRHEISQLKNAVKARSSERDEAIKQLEATRRKYDDATTEHDRTRDDLVQRVADVEELSASLQLALEEQENLRDDLYRKERAQEDEKIEMKHRVQRASKYRDEAAAMLDKTVVENRTLVKTNEKLQAAVEKLKVERDEAVRDLANVQSSVESLEEMSKRGESAHFRLKHERDSLKNERDKLRELLRGVHHDHSEVLNMRTKEQEALSALRLENDALLRKQGRGGGSLRRERDSLKGERDRLQERLREVMAESSNTSQALVSARAEIERLKTEKNMARRTTTTTTERRRREEIDRYSTPLHTRTEREFIGSIDVPPTDPKTPHLARQRSNVNDAEPDGSLGAESLRHPMARMDGFAGPLPTGRPVNRNDMMSSPPRNRNSQSREVADSGASATTARRLPVMPIPNDFLSGTVANMNRYPEYYLSDEDDKELLIAALKSKVKLLERAFMVGHESPNWQP